MADDKRKVDAPQRKVDEPQRKVDAPQVAHPARNPSASGAQQPRDPVRPRMTEPSDKPAPGPHLPEPPPSDKSAPAPQPELMSDRDHERLDELRAMNPAQMPARTPEQEAEFLELERREQEDLWAEQDARVEELRAKVLTPDEARELQDLQMTIDNQRRAMVRRGEPKP